MMGRAAIISTLNAVQKTLVFLTGLREELERHLRFFGAAVILK